MKTFLTPPFTAKVNFRNLTTPTISMNNKSKSRHSNSSRSSRGSLDLQGTRISIEHDYGGLGARYFEQLNTDVDKILLVDTVFGTTETKGTVRGRSIQLAFEMKQRGVRENDTILISSRTHADQTIVVLAALFLGATVCPIDPEYSYKETLVILKKLRPKMCFCDSRSISPIERVFSTINFHPDIVNFGLESGGNLKFCKLFSVRENANFKPVHIDNPKKKISFILPTQGTTGDPKLVCLTHHNMFMHTINFLEIFNNPGRIISFFPLCWIMQATLVCASFDSGMTRILPGDFNERRACKIIHDFVISTAILGTDLAMRLADNSALKDFNLSCLKNIMVGNVTTTKGDIQHLMRLMPNANILQAYALAETGCIAATSVSNYQSSLEKPGSVGRILNNCKIRIIDISTKQMLGPERLGEVYFSGDGTMQGYYQDNSATVAAMEKGFFKTGDIAKYDDDGWLYILGRAEDRITYNDISFMPIEIEDAILSHPLVQDVVVIGRKQNLYACVQVKSDCHLATEDLMRYAAELVSIERLPTKIVFMDDFPRTYGGNVKKRELRESLLEVRILHHKSVASIDQHSSKETIRTLDSNKRHSEDK